MAKKTDGEAVAVQAEAEQAQQTAKPQPGGEGAGLLEKLDAIEQLLRRQAEEGKKAARHRAVVSVLLVCLVVVVGAGLLWMNRTVADATSQLPQLMATANDTLLQAEKAMETVNGLDVDAMNGAILEMQQGLAAIDFDKLNTSITDLQAVAEGLANFMSIFGR